MSDENDVTSEVARVLREHFDPTGTERHDPYAAAVYEEAAGALAEAGLLREFPGRVDGAEGGETSNNSECPCAACDPGYDVGFGFRMASRLSVCPDCGNKRCPKAANHAKWQCSGSNDTGQVGAPVEHPQIVTETGPGATQGGSGDSRASGGLGERLRALIPDRTMHGEDGHFGVTALEVREFADEADRLEASSNGARIKVQLDRVVALADEWASSPAVGSSSAEQWEFDTLRNAARDLRDELAREVP